MIRIWGLLAFASLWSFTACQDKDSVYPAVDLSFTSAEFLLEDLEALAKPYLRDGCDEKAFSIHTVATAKTERQTLTYILPKLNLQANQAASIRDHAQSHQQATSTHRGSISILHQEILMRANAERDTYVKAYNESRISQEQLDAKLLVLRDRVMTELRDHEQKQEHMRVLRNQRSDLMQNIEKVLDRGQLQQWNSWKGSIPS